MKILQLCKKFPFPVKDGETLAVTHLSRAFTELGNEVSLLAMNTTKHHFTNGNIPDAIKHYKSIDYVEVDNRIKLIDAILNLFSPESYHISRFISEEFENKLKKLLTENEYDIIQLETLYLAPYISVIRKYSNAVISMRSHNVEHEIWERVARETSFVPKRIYLKYLTKKLRNYEIRKLNEYDLLVAITNRDLEKFKKFGLKKKGFVTPIGISIKNYEADFSIFDKELSLSFIGSLDWMPNQDGLKWFLQNVWNEMNSYFPDIKLHVAGRNTPKWVENIKMKNVVIHGEVPDAKEFINSHSVMVVPLLAGSGMRAKILEAMALGKVVITTKIGLEGIEAKDRQDVLIADTPEEFIKSLQFCVESNSSLKRIGHNACDFIQKQFDNHNIANRLLEEYKKCSVL